MKRSYLVVWAWNLSRPGGFDGEMINDNSLFKQKRVGASCLVEGPRIRLHVFIIGEHFISEETQCTALKHVELFSQRDTISGYGFAEMMTENILVKKTRWCFLFSRGSTHTYTRVY